VRRVLSLKRLTILVATVAVLAGGAVGVHAIQSRRQAAVLKVQAERAVAAAATDPAKLDEAANLYKQYLKYRRTDEAAYAEYAALMTKRAKADPRHAVEAVNALEGYLRQFPDHPDDRRTLIDLCLRVGRLPSAKQHISLLLKTPAGGLDDDPDLLDKAATCELAAGGDFGTAVRLLDTALKTNRARPEVAERLLGLLNANKAYADPRYTPDQYLDILLTREPYRSDVGARVVAARFMTQKGQLPAARDAIAFALTQLPGGATNADARMAAAELELREIKGVESVQPQLKKAEDHLRTAALAEPKNVGVWLMLAGVLRDQARRGEAIDVLRRAADALGETNDQYLYVVDALLDLGELDLSGRLAAAAFANPLDRDRFGRYVRGRTAVIKGEWTTARELLDGFAGELARVPVLHKKAMVGLGHCYAVAQNPDKMLECYAAALRDDPNYLPAMIGEADALLRLGRLRDARPRYSRLVDGYKIEEFRPTLARLELRAVLSQPHGARKWEAFDAALGPQQGRSAELHILHAESLALRGAPDQAADVLEAVLRTDRKNTEAWVKLARVRGRGDPARYAATLADAEKAAGDSTDLRLARGVGAFTRGRRPTPDDFRPTLAGCEKLSAAQQNRLFAGVGELAVRAAAGTPDATTAALQAFAVECYEKAAELDRGDLVSRAVLVDLGLAMNRPQVAAEALAGLAAIEGRDGPIGALGRVVMRIPEVRAVTDPTARTTAVRELRALAEKAKASRPGWGRVYIAFARLDEMEGLTDSALANYQAAIERNERDEFIIRRAVELLRGKKQDDQAAALLNGLHTEIPLPEDLERFRAVRDLLARDIPQEELPTIDRVAPADHRDWRVLLLRGSLLGAIGRDEDALKAFQSAVNYGPTVPDAWGAMIAQQVRLGRADAAKAAIGQAEKQLAEKPPETAALKADLIDTLAACHELVGDTAAAEAKYLEAAKVAPLELNPTRQLVLFLQRTGRGRDAEEMLRAMGRGAAGDAARWARRHLALTLLAKPDSYHYRADALALVEANLTTQPPDQEDVKAKAMVQTADPKTRAEGLKTLVEFGRWNDLTPDEFYHVGKLHFDQGKVFEAVEYFEKATRFRQGVNAEHLSSLARVYLGTNNVPKARATVARLKSFAPRGWEAAREEARLLKREADDAAKQGKTDVAAGKVAEAKKRILDFPGAADDPFVRAKSGPMLEELGFYADAEALYARLVAAGKGEYPHLPLAVFLINRKRTDEAVTLAKRHEDKATVEMTARILTGAVRVKSPGPAAEREVAEWLDAKSRVSTNPLEQLTLLGCKAELLDALRQYDRAVETYESAIARARGLSPDDQRRFPIDLFVNNLAMLLTLHRPAEADRAIAMMTHVIEVRGPAPAYLDTRAVAYLVKGGRTNEAVEDLKLALIQQHRAGYLFHLAWAYDLDPSRRALRDGPLAEARRMGLTPDDLHPLEARKFAELYAPR
jgi:tetratricopeptide (TPR) repeat protein